MGHSVGERMTLFMLRANHWARVVLEDGRDARLEAVGKEYQEGTGLAANALPREERTKVREHGLQEDDDDENWSTGVVGIQSQSGSSKAT